MHDLTRLNRRQSNGKGGVRVKLESAAGRVKPIPTSGRMGLWPVIGLGLSAQGNGNFRLESLKPSTDRRSILLRFREPPQTGVGGGAGKTNTNQREDGPLTRRRPGAFQPKGTGASGWKASSHRQTGGLSSCISGSPLELASVSGSEAVSPVHLRIKGRCVDALGCGAGAWGWCVDAPGWSRAAQGCGEVSLGWSCAAWGCEGAAFGCDEDA